MRTALEWAEHFQAYSSTWLAFLAVEDLQPKNERDRTRVDALYDEIRRRVDAESASRATCKAEESASCVGGPK